MSAEDRSAPIARDAAPASDEDAWAEVLAAWSDEAVHRRYVDRFPSLEALAIPGGRYTAVLAERPDDAMALRMRAAILTRATAWGLAALPRAKPPLLGRLPRGWTILGFGLWIIFMTIVLCGRGQP